MEKKSIFKKVFEYFDPLDRLNQRRADFLTEHQEAIHKLPQVYIDLLSAQYEKEALAKDFNYIVFDFETTGFDAQQDVILSIGWVEIINGKIDLSLAKHFYIKQDHAKIKAESAVINHITPQMLESGLALDEALEIFLTQAANKLIVAHGCVIEKNFLDHYIKQTYQLESLPLLWLDTLAFEKKMAAARNQMDLDLTLASTRERYQLPEYNSHNALVDAVATAELLLVQKKRYASRKKRTGLTLGDLYQVSAGD